MPQTATKTKKGFPVRCPACGEPSLRVCIDDVTLIACQDCEHEISLDEARRMVDAWTRLVAWLDRADEYTPED